MYCELWQQALLLLNIFPSWWDVFGTCSRMGRWPWIILVSRSCSLHFIISTTKPLLVSRATSLFLLWPIKLVLSRLLVSRRVAFFCKNLVHVTATNFLFVSNVLLHCGASCGTLFIFYPHEVFVVLFVLFYPWAELGHTKWKWMAAELEKKEHPNK